MRKRPPRKDEAGEKKKPAPAPAAVRQKEAAAEGTQPRRGRRGRPDAGLAPPGGAEPAVYLLDRTVTRIFPDGGSMSIVHNVIKVLSKAGVDRFGEVEI